MFIYGNFLSTLVLPLIHDKIEDPDKYIYLATIEYSPKKLTTRQLLQREGVFIFVYLTINSVAVDYR